MPNENVKKIFTSQYKNEGDLKKILRLIFQSKMVYLH